MWSISASIQFIFGIGLALCQPVLLHRAWYRLPFGEFLFLFIFDQFMLYYFFLLPPKASAEAEMELDEDGEPIRRWSDADFASLKTALR